MTNEKRNIQFCKNTLEPAPAAGKNREAFFLSLTFFRGVGNIHLLLDNRSYSCLLMAGRLIEREEFLTCLTRRNYQLDCDLCRVLSAQSAGGGNYKIGKCNGERDNGTSPRCEEKPCKLNFKMTMRLGDLTFYGQ